MTANGNIAIVLAAGLGTRMKTAVPKVLHSLGGRPMLLYLLDAIGEILPTRTVVVTGPEMDDVRNLAVCHKLSPIIAIQKERLGTGHAVMAARNHFENHRGTILLFCGDSPLLTAETIRSLITRKEELDDPAVVVLGFFPKHPGDYGRLILDSSGALQKIVEAKDATADEAAVALCNSGVYALDAVLLPTLLDKLNNDNAKGEYYITDIVKHALKERRRCAVVEGLEDELIGINSKADLASAEAILQNRFRSKAMEDGATLLDPSTIYLSWDTQLGDDVTIGPNVFFGPGVELGDGVEVRSFSHIVGSKVASGSIIGPFARLRPGTDLGADVNIGNFVEVKNSAISEGTKINHLSYVGDAKVGRNVNIGAGTITCNYDGYQKSITEIRDSAFIGSNTALVAPVTVGKGAITGAGSVITQDVEPNSLAVSRREQKVYKDWAKKKQELMDND